MTSSVCGTCKNAFIEKDRHNELQIECRRYPPTLLTVGALPSSLKFYQAGLAVNMNLEPKIIGSLKQLKETSTNH